MRRRELEVAVAAATEAARIHRAIPRDALEIGTKSTRTDLVTRADKDSEAAILRILSAAFPHDGFLGEEGASRHGERTWVVDPLDGTLNFAHGFPYYAVSIALVEGGRPKVAVVLDSARGELFSAVQGQGAFADGRPLRVTDRAVLGEAMLGTGFSYDEARQRENVALFGYVLPRVRAVRRPGAASLDLCAVAAGRFDGFWELALAPWDVAAGWLIVEEAGGRISTEDGGPYELGAPCVVGSNGVLHDGLVALLAAARAASL